MMRYPKAMILLSISILVFIGTASANEFLRPGDESNPYNAEVQAVFEQSRDRRVAGKINLDINAQSSSVREQEAEIARSFGVDLEALTPHIEANQTPDDYQGKHILVFISSSLPKANIENLYKLLGDRSDVVFVLRGFIGDASKIKPTQEWVRSIVCPAGPGQEPSFCYKAPIDINPVFFERMGINEVPALAYVPDPKATLTTCEEPSGEHYTFFGDITPSYALERISTVIPGDEQLKKIIASMRQPFHEGAGG